MPNARLAVDKAVFDALNVAAVLAVAPGGVHNSVAPAGTRPPWVVYQTMALEDEYTFGLRGANMLYMAKAVTDKPWPKAAMDVDTEIDSVLEDATLTITGFNQVLCRRQQDIYYTEEAGGKVWQHIGGIYRIIADES